MSSSAGRALDERRQRRHAAIRADRGRAQRGGRHQLRVRVELRVQRAVDLELAHPLDRPPHLRLAEQLHEIGPDPLAGDGRQRVRGHRLARQALGLRLEPELEPGRVADGAQEARGVVEEAAVVEHADEPGLEVGEAAERVVQVPEVVPGEPDGERVHGEVAAPEVLRQRRRRRPRQRARRLVGLLPAWWQGGRCPSGVMTSAVPNRSYSRDLAAQPVGHRAGRRASVALDGHVDVLRCPRRRRRSRTAPPTR